jgi:hypothetical protein
MSEEFITLYRIRPYGKSNCLWPTAIGVDEMYQNWFHMEIYLFLFIHTPFNHCVDRRFSGQDSLSGNSIHINANLSCTHGIRWAEGSVKTQSHPHDGNNEFRSISFLKYIYRSKPPSTRLCKLHGGETANVVKSTHEFVLRRWSDHPRHFGLNHWIVIDVHRDSRAPRNGICTNVNRHIIIRWQWFLRDDIRHWSNPRRRPPG